MNSEAGSSMGNRQNQKGRGKRDQAAKRREGEHEGAGPGRPQRGSKARGSPLWAHREEPRGDPDSDDSFFSLRQDEEEHLGPGWSRRGSYSGLSGLLRGWGQTKANDSGWPMFDGKFVN
jgi:hypothetical protein